MHDRHSRRMCLESRSTATVCFLWVLRSASKTWSVLCCSKANHARRIVLTDRMDLFTIIFLFCFTCNQTWEVSTFVRVLAGLSVFCHCLSQIRFDPIKASILDVQVRSSFWHQQNTKSVVKLFVFPSSLKKFLHYMCLKSQDICYCSAVEHLQSCICVMNAFSSWLFAYWSSWLLFIVHLLRCSIYLLLICVITYRLLGFLLLLFYYNMISQTVEFVRGRPHWCIFANCMMVHNYCCIFVTTVLLWTSQHLIFIVVN